MVAGNTPPSWGSSLDEVVVFGGISVAIDGVVLPPAPISCSAPVEPKNKVVAVVWPSMGLVVISVAPVSRGVVAVIELSTIDAVTAMPTVLVCGSFATFVELGGVVSERRGHFGSLAAV